MSLQPRCLFWAGLLVALLAAAGPALAEPYVMKEGDTLWEIARTRYGDPQFYKDLQKANDIENVRNIPNGTVINLPSKATLLKLRQTTDPAERQRILKADGAGSTPPAVPAAGPTPFDPVLGLGSRVNVPRTGGAGN